MHRASLDIHHSTPPRYRGGITHLSLCLAAVLLAAPGFAAGESRAPGVIDRPSGSLPDLERGAPGELPATPRPAPPSTDETDTPIATFDAVTFAGMSVISAAELSRVAAAYLHRPLSSADLAQLKFDLTRLYFERGYVLVKITTPPQDISGGILKIVIHEARVGQLQLNYEGLLRERIATALARQLKRDAVFHEGDIESLANDYNDLTGLRAALTLHKGAAPGTTDLTLNLTEEDEDIQQFTLDNYGSDLTGNWVGGARLQTSNRLRLGETLGLQLRASGGDLWSAGIDARSPLGLNNMWLQFEYSHSENTIGGSLAYLDASGSSDRASLSLSSALINTRSRKATLRSGLEIRRHVSELAQVTESRDQIRQWLVEGSYLLRQTNWMTYGAVTLTKGLNLLGASEQGDALASRSHGEPAAWRLQPLLYGVLRLGADKHVKAVFSGQIASHTLLSSDLFALGGYGSVRGFQPAESTGETGAQYSLEYLQRLGAWSTAQWTAGIFSDGGWVWNREDNSVADDTLISAGLSVEAAFRAQTRRGTTLRVDAAAPLGEYQAKTVDDFQILVRLTHLF